MTLASPIPFTLPEANIAVEPAELRGVDRSDIRLMVADRRSGSRHHDVFNHLDHYLRPGDVVVVNTSATLPAALVGTTADGAPVAVHVASPAPGGLWSLEIRTIVGDGGTGPGPEIEAQKIHLPGNAVAHLLARSPRSPRLWIAVIEGADDVAAFLENHGRPIRYAPGPRLPLSSYQTVFATDPGSAEMPSAGRPFTNAMVTRLVSKGVAVVPITLHAGVSSFEDGETPGEERFEVPTTTAAVVNTLRSQGGRVIAIGTTVVRALETAVDDAGEVHPGRGSTDLVITPERGVRAVDGLLTGWHEPRSSHLTLLEAFLSRAELQEIYEAAVTAGYLWHEFGDELLIL